MRGGAETALQPYDARDPEPGRHPCLRGVARERGRQGMPALPRSSRGYELRVALPAAFGREEIVVPAAQAIGIPSANGRAYFID